MDREGAAGVSDQPGGVESPGVGASETSSDQRQRARNSVVIAVDGPAGAGKSTVARALAGRLGVPYIDTGAMYRAVGLLAARAGMGANLGDDDGDALCSLVRRHRIRLEPGADGVRVLVDDEDITDSIRSPEVSTMASAVSAVPAVRRALVPVQREMARDRGGVMEGRDIGTVVFPDATLKVFLTADPEERTRRRWRELRDRGVRTTPEAVRREQDARDERDSSREDSPLRPADDAVIVDSTDRTVGQVVDAILAQLERVGGRRLTEGGPRS